MDRETQAMLDRWQQYHDEQMTRARLMYCTWAGVSLLLAVILFVQVVA